MKFHHDESKHEEEEVAEDQMMADSIAPLMEIFVVFPIQILMMNQDLIVLFYDVPKSQKKISAKI